MSQILYKKWELEILFYKPTSQTAIENPFAISEKEYDRFKSTVKDILNRFSGSLTINDKILYTDSIDYNNYWFIYCGAIYESEEKKILIKLEMNY